MSPLDDDFRSELKSWLGEHAPPAVQVAATPGDAAALREWQRTLHAGNWVGIHWPVEYGGRGASSTQVAIYNEELARAGVPPILGRAGVTLVGPTLMTHGTERQRMRWMPRILGADDVWCQLFSEPGAGSDLASLSTRAEKSGGAYRVSGQKVWSSYATFADMGIALVRTDAQAPAHKGISMLAIPMDAVGVDVRPLRQMTGESEFNEVFLDDVEVPVENLVGAENEGWQVANTTLANERGASFIWREQVLHQAAFAALAEECGRAGTNEDRLVRQRLAQSWIDIELFRLHNARTLARLGRGEEIGVESSIVKLFWATISQRFAETALAILGPDVLCAPGRWAHALLSTRANSIMGGTSEIQRNIIGQRILGLPREPRGLTMIEIDALDLVDPERYARSGYPHSVWTRLRAVAPVARVEPTGYKPFWAITKHADILQIASQPAWFSSAQGITLAREGAAPVPPTEILVMIDPPRHGPMRRVVNARFMPRAVRARGADVERIAADVLDRVANAGESSEGDFVESIAAPFPLAVIAWILGVPSADWELLFRWTNEIIGKDDPQYRRAGESPGQTMKRARGELGGFFERLIDERRASRRDDLVSELLDGKVDGAPLREEQLLSYCELFVEAGNETTRNAISGGLLAFCERPDEWQKLRANPDLLPTAVEEILRWASPISHFTRVATEDCEIRGVAIAAGDQLALYFASANRDEDVFEDPFEFRVDRNPNPHLAFGFGEHVCLGAHLARVELETIFRHLLVRLESFELAGEIERLKSAVNGSIKQLPLRYRLV